MVKFVECAFVGNRVGEGDITLRQNGVVTSLSEYNELTFISCIFTNNVYMRGGDGYAVKTGGSDLIIRDTCIFDNDFAGYGAVQHFGSGSIKANNNFARYNGNNLTCAFIAQSSQSGLLRYDVPGNLTCIEADALVCPLNGTTVNPDSDAPSMIPSSIDGTLNPTGPGVPTAPTVPTAVAPPAPTVPREPTDTDSDMPSTIPTITTEFVSPPPAVSTGQPTKTLAPTPASPRTASPTAGGDAGETIAPATPSTLSSDSPSNVPSTNTIAKGGVSTKGITSQGFLLPLPFFHLYTLSLVPIILYLYL
jgi:hypothetical protein